MFLSGARKRKISLLMFNRLVVFLFYFCPPTVNRNQVSITNILAEMNDGLVKRAGGGNYFDELLAE